MRRLGIVLGVLVAFGGLARSRWAVVTVRGSSMAPTLVDGQRLLVCRVLRAPRRGEVIVFGTEAVEGIAGPGDDPPCRVKRVHAVPGDPMPAWVGGRERLVPQGFVVVSGDNPRSQDSRQLGLIDHRRVVGVARAPRPRTVRAGR